MIMLNLTNYVFINDWVSQSFDWDILYSFIIRIQRYIVLVMCYYYFYTWFYLCIDFYEYILVHMHYALFNYFYVFWYVHVWYIMCILYWFYYWIGFGPCQEWIFGKEYIVLFGWVFILVKKGLSCVLCWIMPAGCYYHFGDMLSQCICMEFNPCYTAMHSYYYVQWT